MFIDDCRTDASLADFNLLDMEGRRSKIKKSLTTRNKKRRIERESEGSLP
jgi:hypothetical protein